MQDSRWKYRPSLAENIILILATLPILEQHSRLPEVSFAIFLLCGVPASAVIALWIVRAGLMAIRSSEPGEDDALTPTLAASWLIIPAVTLVLLFSALMHWPASVRFYFSRGAFEQEINKVYRGQSPADFPRWIGLYWIEDVYDSEFNPQTKSGTYGFITGKTRVDECGLYYDPANPTPRNHLTSRVSRFWYLTEW